MVVLFDPLGAATSPQEIQDGENTLGHLSAMLLQESSGYALPTACSDRYYYDHRKPQEQDNHNDDRIKEGWRRKICEWSFAVVDHFGFDREIVCIALSFLDRCVSTTSPESSSSTCQPKTMLMPTRQLEFQLLAVTCLYIAMKLHGETEDAFSILQERPKRKKLKIVAFVELSRGLFRVHQIEAMERNVLTILDWRLNPPTPVRFVAGMLRLAAPTHDHSRTTSSLFETARYLTELTVCVSNISFRFQPSLVAYASILCSMEILYQDDSSQLHAMVDFVNHLASLYHPQMEQVHQARWMLMDLYISMLDDDTESSSQASSNSHKNNMLNNNTTMTKPGVEQQHCRKKSPVCVWDLQ